MMKHTTHLHHENQRLKQAIEQGKQKIFYNRSTNSALFCALQ